MNVGEKTKGSSNPFSQTPFFLNKDGQFAFYTIH